MLLVYFLTVWIAGCFGGLIVLRCFFVGCCLKFVFQIVLLGLILRILRAAWANNACLFWVVCFCCFCFYLICGYWYLMVVVLIWCVCLVLLWTSFYWIVFYLLLRGINGLVLRVVVFWGCIVVMCWFGVKVIVLKASV